MMVLWRRLVLLGVSFGIGVVAATVALYLGIRWYNNRPQLYRVLPKYDLGNGLVANLKTEWRDGQIYYALRIMPAEPSKVKAFDVAIRNESAPKGLAVHFEDKAGMELCSISFGGYTENPDDNGLVSSLSATGHSQDCSRSQYAESASVGGELMFSWESLPILAPPDFIPDSQAGSTPSVGRQVRVPK